MVTKRRCAFRFPTGEVCRMPPLKGEEFAGRIHRIMPRKRRKPDV